MRQVWLKRTGEASLVLVFGGWALGPGPFASLEAEGEDILFVDGYASLDDGLGDIGAYERVSLLAFSFGVASAAHWLSSTGRALRPDRLVAIAGTLHPADPVLGIAPKTIRATADGLTEASFAKFCRRSGLEGPAPEIDIAQAAAELHAIAERGSAPGVRFDRIWITGKDRIVPAAAQDAAWAGEPSDAIRRIAAPHVPFRPGQRFSDWMV